ncbi:amino acid adenylation domain-containing protein [Kitasatospora sp. NPDC018058]|uniref:amino acid adenylation domain-containing protein n=1 Tax=Kitasatospora sp. NPDC018058 TaxID=3364025 RepID=UPI0037BEDC5C
MPDQIIELDADVRARARTLRDTAPDAAVRLSAAVAALAIHYAAYTREEIRLDLAEPSAGPVRAVRVAVDPDQTLGELADRITRGAAGSRSDPADHLVVLGDTWVSGTGTGWAYQLRLDPDEPGTARCRFDEDRATAAGATALLNVFAALLGQALADPARPVRGYAPLAPAERPRVLHEFNDTGRDFPRDATLHALFREQALRSPDRVAVSSDRGSLTYRQLDERAERLAYALTRRGLRPGEVVAVLTERSLDLPVALFGVLKAGCAYLPLDPHAPERRLRGLVEQSGARFVLAGEVPAADTDLPADVLRLADPALYAEEPPRPLELGGPGDLAYVIYTSGSTGRPKGVMVEHRSVVNRLAWMQRRYPLGPEDTLLQKTPVIFDVSVWELFWWLLAGARMHLLAPGMERFPMAIVAAAEQQRVTALHFVPSMLNVFLDHLRESGAGDRLAALRWVFSSGESLAAQTVTAFHGLTGAHGTKLVNLYGPTEATVDVTAHDCPPGPAEGRVPIGRPIDNTRFYVLRHGQPMPVGVYGTLHVAGAGVARGYLGDPELTRRRFGPEYGRPGERMYDTGDIGRWLPSGDIEFLGRDDLQVKIRGIRIDLLEVEGALLELPGVADCAVTLDRPGPTLDVLRAAVTGDPGLSGDRLRTHLAERLPAYMLPATYDYFEQLPRTPSGKVDRRALADAAYLTAHATRL